MLEGEKLENFLVELEGLLNEIKEEQAKQGKNMQHYHKVNMKNFSKLKEYNEICDMTNQIFEKRISNIEQVLQEIARKTK